MLITTIDEARLSRDRNTRIPLAVRRGACVVALAVSDVLSFVLAAAFYRVWHREPTVFVDANWTLSSHGTRIDVFVILAVLFVGLSGFGGDYSRREPFWDGVRSTMTTLFVIFLPGLIAISFAHKRSCVVCVAACWVLLFVAIPSLRQFTRKILARSGVWQRKSALIGNGAAAEIVRTALSKSLSLGFDVQWLVSIGSDMSVPKGPGSLKRIISPGPGDAGLLVRAAGCDQAILALSDVQDSAYPELVRRLSEANIETVIIPPLARLPLGHITASVLFGRNILLFRVGDNLRRWPQQAAKRLFDIIGALAALIVLSPVFAVIAISVKRQDGGAVTYSHARIGRDGRVFRCLKFRTMVPDADTYFAHWQAEYPNLVDEFRKSFKLRDDPRITPIGNWLRRTSLDELPQLINILLGDMSFVGPRPVVEKELLDYYGPAAQLYMRVRPGLTGLWQISGRNDTTYEDRIAFDEWYILNWSMWYDIIIIAQTFGVISSGYGAY